QTTDGSSSTPITRGEATGRVRFFCQKRAIARRPANLRAKVRCRSLRTFLRRHELSVRGANMISSATVSAIRGIETGFDSAAKNADTVAKLGQDGGDAVQALVTLNRDALQIVSSTKVIRTEDDRLHALLDM